MGIPREPTYSLITASCFSRHPEALKWAVEQLTARFGPLALSSPDYSFHHTKYYASTMGTGLLKRIVVFEPIVGGDCLAEAKRFAIGLEDQLITAATYPEARPLNIDPGLVQLGKFLLASTKDQAHRIELHDRIFAEVTLRFQAGAFEAWPWTYADYREPLVLEFLNRARAHLYERVLAIRTSRDV
jgi:hypothetical protein